MNPQEKAIRAAAKPGALFSRKSKCVVNGTKISREATKLAYSCLLHHGVDVVGPNRDAIDGGFIPQDKFLGAIHELANNARITNDAMVAALVKHVGSLVLSH